MAASVYTELNQRYAKGEFDWDPGVQVFKMLLLNNNGAAFNAAHRFVSEVIAGSAELAAGTGYTRQTLTTIAGTYARPSVCDANDVVFGALSALASPNQLIKAAIVYREINASDDAQNWLCFHFDGGTAPDTLPLILPVSSFNVVWPATGVVLVGAS